jgi:REP element-mobilizing transposase RayT
MARPIRVEFAGAVYHVMARGNERRTIFRDDQDRRRFVGEMAEQHGVRVHAYCLMPNHYHLIAETPRGNLSQAVGWLQVTYTVRFNRRHRRSGHLFQGRFKAQVVEADEYAQWLVEYVHLNPVRPRRKGEAMRADQARQLDAYAWSSHRDYAGLRRKPAAWLSLNWLRYWGQTPTEARAGYRRRIASAFAAGTVASPWEQLKGGLVLGGESLWERAKLLVAGKTGAEEATWSRAANGPACRQRARLLTAGETDEWVQMWARVKLAGERKIDVAREFGYAGGSSVIYALRRLEQKANRDRVTRSKLRHLREQFEILKS